ncbi:MAG: molybdopterin molybdotransferase MoeA [Gordonia paraffinivorans]
MTTVDEHRAALADLGITGRPATVALAAATGALCDEDIRTHRPVPGHDTAAMDGFACRSEDLRRTATLTVAAVSLAGRRDQRIAVTPGCAVQVMTGAPVPDCADIVVPVEATSGFVEGPGAEVTVDRVPARTNISRVGSEIAVGTTLVPAGSVLRPPTLGALAAIGRSTVRVRSTLTVAVLSTGTELVPADVEPADGEVPESNSGMIAADLRTIPGVCVLRAPVVADDRATFLDAMHEYAARSDLVVTTGGIGMGTADVVRSTLGDDVGFTFCRVAMKPGRPQGRGRFAGTPTICLPGSPAGAFVSYELFVRPRVVAALGRPDLDRRTLTGTYAGLDIPSPTEGVRVVPGRRDADGVVRAETSRAGLVQLATCDCWFVVDGDGLTDGDAVTVSLL